MADFGRQTLNRRGDDTQSGKIHRVTVARNDLGRDWLNSKAKLGRDMGLNFGVDIGECANGA